jgi:hypothetical protein
VFGFRCRNENGVGLSRKDVQILAFKLAQKLGINYRFCVAKGRDGEDLFASYMRRHSEISVRKAEGYLSAELRE